MTHGPRHHGRHKSKTRSRPLALDKKEGVSFLNLYTYTTKRERALLALAIFACIVAGSMIPTLDHFFGTIAELMVKLEQLKNNVSNVTCALDHEKYVEDDKKDDVYHELQIFAIAIGCVGLVHFGCCYCYITIFNYVAEKQTHRLKTAYLKGLFRQDLIWHDLHSERHDFNFVSSLLEDTSKIQDATGEKVGLCLYIFFTSICSVIFALYHGTKLTLVVASVAPLMILIAAIAYKLESRLTAVEEHEFAKSDLISDEALAHIKAVKAFAGEEKEAELYQESLNGGRKASSKKALVDAIGGGILWFLHFAAYSLAFWYGSMLVLDHEYCGDENEKGYTVHALMVCFNVIIATYEICNYFTYIDVFAEGCHAAGFIFFVIKRVPEIDPYSTSGIILEQPMTGTIEFHDVVLSFPPTPTVEVLKRLTVTFRPGVNCIVGPTGSGKSLILSLISRFYDPTEGHVLIDDRDLREYNLGWLRKQIGVITQEPILFNTTIEKNIRVGKEDATPEEIVRVCQISLIHDFILSLPHGYDTIVGAGGILLSHPHKMRVAISRALIRDPAILLFDEAVVPLETRNQSQVLQNLIESRRNQTTIIVAHLLSTMQSADVVISVVNGKVAEIGSNSELLRNKGFYYHLCQRLRDDGVPFDSETTLDLPTQTQQNYSSESSPQQSQVTLKTTEILPEDTPSRLSRSPSITNMEYIEEVVVKGRFITDDLDKKKRAALWRLLKINRPEWFHLILGCLMALLIGCAPPFYAFLFGKVLSVFANSDIPKARADANLYSWIIFVLGFVAGLAMCVMTICFSWSGEHLTARLRKLCFAAITTQELEFYENPLQHVNTLYARLSADASSVQGATGIRFGSVLQAVTTFVTAIAISLSLSLKLGALTTLFAPVTLAATLFTIRLIQGQQLYEKVAAEEVSKLTYDAYNNIRTVGMLGKELDFVNTFTEALAKPHKQALKLSHYLGLIHGLSQSSIYFTYSFVIIYGSYLLKQGDIEYPVVFTIGEALTWCMLVLGQTLAFAPNYSKATVSANRIFQLLDRESKLLSAATTTGVGSDSTSALEMEGDIKFEDVDFRETSRPGANVLNKFSLNINAGETVFFVGTMDGGKYAVIPLIIRLYDPQSGNIYIENYDIKSWDVNTLRSQIGIVFHEPFLFHRTIKQNIAYGNNKKIVAMDEIEAAAKAANIHDFIESLPKGYDTMIGGGIKLTPSQQRGIAVARALVRNPKLLLLEDVQSTTLEFDSDMDMVNGMDILDPALTEGRSCIAVATQLSTVRNADRIVLINDGAVAEEGTHESLYAKKGYYYKLWNLQHLGLHIKKRSKKSGLFLT